MVWFNEDVLMGGFLFLGTSVVADPKAVSGAFPIRKFQKVPGVRARITERKAIL